MRWCCRLPHQVVSVCKPITQIYIFAEAENRSHERVYTFLLRLNGFNHCYQTMQQMQIHLNNINQIHMHHVFASVHLSWWN